jgi:1,4-alpha-glucan branching enzyme
LDWHLLETDFHKSQQALSKDLNHLYQNEVSLHFDHSHQGFEWISYDDSANSILAFARKAKDQDAHSIAVINFTPTPHSNYRIGVPKAGCYQIIMNTDDSRYTGSGYVQDQEYNTHAVSSHGREHSIELQIPPLAGVLLKWLGES